MRPMTPHGSIWQTFLITIATLLAFTSLFASDSSVLRLSQLPPEAQSSILATLTASNGQAGDSMGLSVAVDGDTIVVGSPQQGPLPGAVYVFVKPTSGWANMTQTATLTASDENSGTRGNLLGVEVTINGDTIVAGAPQSGSSVLGALYVYVKPKTGWKDATETARLTNTDLLTNCATFGNAVAIDGNTIVATNPCSNAAYVYVKPAGGWASGTQTAKLSPSSTNCKIFGVGGHPLSFSGDTAVVGCYLQYRGTAYVFSKPVTGWQDMTETAQLRAWDGTPADDFSSAVAISKDTILIGSPSALVSGVWSGAAYIFLKPATGWKTTKRFAAKLFPSDGTSPDSFGLSVALNGTTAVIGSPLHPNQGSGAVYVFARPASGWTNMNRPASVVGTGIVDFGFSVAISGSTIVSGEPTAKIGNNNAQGAAFVLGQ